MVRTLTSPPWSLRLLLAAAIGLLALNSLGAQFSGGPGDGFTAVAVVQLTFDGVPAGVRAVYRGGPGDGFDRTSASVTVSGVTLARLFRGGRGDGFDRASATLTLSGTDLAIVFSGGSGDGFDRASAFVTLGGDTLGQLFVGGAGDGFDRAAGQFSLDGTSLAILYGGGAGDGFDADRQSLLVDGTPLAILYGGGAGDGFDVMAFSSTLTGLDLAGLYGGGDGDGFDAAYFAGIVPFPLTLISFEAFPGEDFVLLKWVTEDEVDTDFFTVEKTVDGREFATVGNTAAAGTSDPGVRLHYRLRDGEPYDGSSFYRLRTTDFDGAISLSHLVEVRFSRAQDWSFTLFPNPSTGRHFSVRTAGLRSGEPVTLEVLDAAGRRLFVRDYRATTGDAFRFDLEDRLAAGSYLIRLRRRAGAEFLAKLLLVQ